MFRFLPVRSAGSAAAAVALTASFAWAQQPVPQLPAQASPAGAPLTMSGQVRRAGSLEPVPNATIIVEGTALETTSDREGRFTLSGVPADSRHVIIAAPKLQPLRAEVTIVGGVAAPLDAILDTEVHYTETVSVSPDPRDQFASYQPTSVLAGQDLSRELESTLGATLERQPGVSERSFGPGPSRPVIRGLDGDRVLILEDGQRVGDLSSQSGDHGVPVNPASASRIEVVRGPATLLYGANAIGGLVNLINETIPTRPIQGLHGGLVVDAGSAAKELVGGADVTWGNGRLAVHADGSGRRNGDVATADGDVENTQSRAGFGNLGISWTGTRGFFGGSYGYDNTRYGIPFVEEGRIELTPRRHMIALKGEVTKLGGLFEGVRADFASRRYRHEEIVGGETGTRFDNNTDELNLLVRQRPAGRLTGTIGGWVLNRNFLAEGEEALSPPVKERGAAAFFYEEVTWPHFTFQFGARVNHASYDPEEDLPSREFTDASGSIGLLFRPAAAEDKLTMSINLARASRNPALEELYFFGPHPGNFAFEIGNPNLDSEAAFGFDASLRWRAPRVTGELTYFRNSIDDYILRSPISEEEFDERYGHEAHGGEEGEEGHEGDFPFIEYIAADSLLQGIEAHADIQAGGGFGVELGLDYVHGELRSSNQPLHRIPPVRVRGGVKYQRAAFQAGGEVVAVAKQDRVFGEETPTDGYGLLKLFASYSFGNDRVSHTITARLDNATNELYRNHLSLIKDHVPEMGRNVKVVFATRF
ncbi:MAG: TonB-dependent receptor [Vicinamibacterales bacterium]